MQITIKIDTASYRQHALEQDGTHEEIAETVKADVTRLTADMNYLLVAEAIAKHLDNLEIVQTARDSYANLSDAEAEETQP